MSGEICTKTVYFFLNEVMYPIHLPMHPFRVLLWQPYPERLLKKCSTIQ